MDTGCWQEAKSLEHRLTELQRDSNSRDCHIADLTSRLTTETYRARKSEGALRKVLEEEANKKAEKEEIQGKLDLMQQGSRGLQNDLDRLETENSQLSQQLAAIRYEEEDEEDEEECF